MSSDGDGALFGFLITQDNLNGDLLDLCFSDAVAQFLVAVIQLSPETFSLQSLGYRSGIISMLGLTGMTAN